MIIMLFDSAVKHILQFEGGYVNDPDDAGGETNFGISKRSYPDEDIAGLTIDHAKDIYRRDYWDAVRADELPEYIRLSVFDMAVNMGTKAAVRILQKSVGAGVDGAIGPKTIAAANRIVSGADVDILTHRMEYYVDIVERKPTQIKYLKGWLRRAIEV